MADLIQITTPVAGRGYDNMPQGNRQQNVQQNPTGQVFDLGNQTQIVKTNDRGGENANQDLKDENGSVLMRSPADSIKNALSALNTAKALLSEETISLIRESGDTETLSKLTEFASEVMLSPENLSEDMVQQQKSSTIFGDRLWGVLKDIIDMTGSKSLEAGTADFAKAAADLSSKGEILRSLSANFKFLASEAAPGKAVSDELAAASKALAGADAEKNFSALKPTLLKLLGYTERSLLLTDETKNLLPLIVHSMSRYTDSPEALRESFESLLNLSENVELTPEQTEKLGLDPQKTLSENLRQLFDSYVIKSEYMNDNAKITAMFSKELAGHEEQMKSNVNLLAAGAKHMTERIPPEELTRVISTVDFSQGAEAMRKVLGAVIPNTPAMRNALQSIFDELEQTGDLDRTVERLNVILESMDSSSESAIKLAQGLNSALSEMMQSGRDNVSRETSMEVLTDFLTKNINNSFLQSLSGMNSGDMVQNLLTAPGVLTPLLHQFVPLDAFGIRAFGEMWIDPNADELIENTKNNRKSTGDSPGNHMFLCFDIEDTGYFELEIYEKNKSMSVMLLCPEALEEEFMPIKETIPKIAEANGYRVTASIVEASRGKRSLDKVFPKLSEPKNSLNLKV